jgi:hypothetical protein
VQGIDHAGDAERVDPSSRRAEAQGEDDLLGELADHAIDVVRVDAGIGQCAERRLEGDRLRIMAGQRPGLLGVVHADDGDVAEGVSHWLQHRWPTGRASSRAAAWLWAGAGQAS